MIDLYAKETGTEVVPETYAWNDYWQKLATQAAGRNLPDLIQMDYRFIFEYARRQQLAALDDFSASSSPSRTSTRTSSPRARSTASSTASRWAPTR